MIEKNIKTYPVGGISCLFLIQMTTSAEYSLFRNLFYPTYTSPHSTYMHVNKHRRIINTVHEYEKRLNDCFFQCRR